MEKFNENLVIVDNIPWLQKFMATALHALGKGLVIMPSSTAMHRSYSRFRDAPRIVIHWESTHRHGGALIEELLEIAPYFPVADRIVILTTNPHSEDVFYFSELGLKRIVRVIQHKPGFQLAFKELKIHFAESSKLNPFENAWQKIHKYIDGIKSKPTEEQLRTVEKAISELRKKSTGQPSARYFDAIASVADLKGESDIAEMNWLKALDINPNFFRASENLTQFYEKGEKFSLAVNLLQRLNQRNKHSITRMIQLGRVHRKINRDDKAEHYFQLALDKDRYCNRALNGLAEIRFDQGNYAEAKELLRRSKTSIDTASYLNQRGIELVKQNKFEEALHLYQNAQFVLPLQDKGPMLFYNIGLCYSRWGKHDKAVDYLRLALIKKPDYDKASILLKKVLSFQAIQQELQNREGPQA